MINKFVALLLLSVSYLSGSAQFSDDFSDGDFTNNPSWSGNDALFVINNGELQSNNPTANEYYLSTSSALASSAEWIFDINLKFSTSGSNFADVFLMSDNADLTTAQNGYFVRVGSTQDDIKLYSLVGGTETIIIDAADGLINSSSNNPFRIKVTRDGSDNWTLEHDDAITGSFVSAGNITDNSVNSSSFFGIRITQSGAAGPINNHFFDNFYAGVIGADTQPPQVDSVVVVSSNDLKVYFNETVEINSAQNVTNYLADNGLGNPISATRNALDSAVVDLSFTNAFVNGQTNQLTIENVTDNSGNSVNTTQVPFTYVLIIPANYGDVVISEIFADPSPSVGLPGEEYVELFNTTNTTFNLANWQFVNTTTIKTLSNFILAPNAYVILCNNSDTGLFQPYGDVLGVSSFSALTNGGDSLTLLDELGNIVDIVNYDISWYNDEGKDDGGYSLELINPTHPCGSSSSNWSASANSTGGTPGTQNAVFDTTPDVTTPTISEITVITATEIEVLFNEKMDSSSLANATYLLNNGNTISTATVNSNLQSVQLVVSPALDSSLVYELIANGISDCSGNTTNASYEFGIGVAPFLFDVVITELFPDPSPSVGLPEQEYIELYNRTNKVIDLTGCWVADLSSANQIQGGKLFPGEYAIICDDNNYSDFITFGKVITVSSLPSLNNSNENYQLYNSDSVLIHNVHYFDEWYNDENKQDGGWSLEMIDFENPCGESENWTASNKWFGGTPGTENSVYASNPDNISPSLISANAVNDSTVIIEFDETMFLGAISINSGITINSIEQVDGKTYQINTNEKLLLQTIYTLTVTGVNDCVGNGIIDNEKDFALPETAIQGDLVINEVLFNPRDGGSDFVEIYNNSNKYISLQDWKLANLDNDSIDNYKTISANPHLLAPREFATLTTNPGNIKQEYFDAVESTFMSMDALPTYSNDEGSVYLLNDSNEVIDFFNYNEDMHFALLNEVDGVSLERIDYNRNSNDATNWHSAAEAVGFATPGYENSQYLNAESIDEITISPETFSPNNDGIDDVVNISYNFNESGMVANVLVYDSRGRLIRNLIKSEYIADNGTFSWDGINDNNEKAGVGIYILYIEVFNATGDVKKYKKTCVLASQLN